VERVAHRSGEIDARLEALGITSR